MSSASRSTRPRKTLEDEGLAFTKVEEPTPGAVEGAVVATDPVAGTIVTKDQSINVVLQPDQGAGADPRCEGEDRRGGHQHVDRRRVHGVTRHPSSSSTRQLRPARC